MNLTDKRLMPVIMAGGNGSRLWPLSRNAYPKQFLPLTSERSLFQETLARIEDLQAAPPMVVCNHDHRFLVAEQMRMAGIKPSSIILEPLGRNTAPAIALAAFQALEQEADPLLLVLPSDHVIGDVKAFEEAVKVAAEAAIEGRLATFGVVPNKPETGYGYIRCIGAASHRGPSLRAWPIDGFVEKPDLETAEAYLRSGEYLWNSGMFLFSANRYLEELKVFRPEIHACCEKAAASMCRDMDFTRVDKDIFAVCPSDSIDYAVMEQTRDAVVAPLDAGWNDLGSWSALQEISETDVHGNVVQGDVMTEDVSNSYIRSEHKLVTAMGVENLIIVDTSDALLVADKHRGQDIRKLVEKLKEEGRGEHSVHRKVYRPWGWYDLIHVGERHQVKRICVNPGARLSLQMHHHRAEHWVVVHGAAKVVRGEEELLLGENQSTYIPVGVKHCLENPGVMPLEIIEVQSGSYLGEDDIVRLDDRYGRA